MVVPWYARVKHEGRSPGLAGCCQNCAAISAPFDRCGTVIGKNTGSVPAGHRSILPAEFGGGGW